MDRKFKLAQKRHQAHVEARDIVHVHYEVQVHEQLLGFTIWRV